MTAGAPERRYTIGRALNVSRWRPHPTNPIQRTPPALFRQLDAEFAFTLDAAASPANHLCARYFTRTDDALGQPWAPERVWLNPPYGRGLAEWMRKAWEESRAGALVVALVPSATDLAWWHDYALAADEVRFVRGRVSFVSEDGRRSSNALTPTAVLIFRPASTGERASLALPAPHEVKPWRPLQTP